MDCSLQTKLDALILPKCMTRIDERLVSLVGGKDNCWQHRLEYAEIAASMLIIVAKRAKGLVPVVYSSLAEYPSEAVFIKNPGEKTGYTTTKLLLGIRVLREMDLITIDPKTEAVIPKETLLDRVFVSSLYLDKAFVTN